MPVTLRLREEDYIRFSEAERASTYAEAARTGEQSELLDRTPKSQLHQNASKSAEVDTVTQDHPTTDTGKAVLEGLKSFAQAERARTQAERQTRKAEEGRAKTIEFLEFSKTFKLKTPIPEDLISILTKDVEKQKKLRDQHQARTTFVIDPRETAKLAPVPADHYAPVSGAARALHDPTRSIKIRSSRAPQDLTGELSSYGGMTSTDRTLSSKRTTSTAPTSDCGKVWNETKPLTSETIQDCDAIEEEKEEEETPALPIAERVMDTNDQQDNQSYISDDSVVVLTSEQQQDVIYRFAQALLRKLPGRHLMPQKTRASADKFRHSLSELLKEYSDRVRETTARPQRHRRQAAKQIRILRRKICDRYAHALGGIFNPPPDRRTQPGIVKHLELINPPEKTWEQRVSDWRISPHDESINNVSQILHDSTLPQDYLDGNHDPLRNSLIAQRALSSAFSSNVLSVSDYSQNLDSSESPTQETIHLSTTEDNDIYTYLTSHNAFTDLARDLEKLVERDYCDKMALIRHRVLLGLRRTYGHHENSGVESMAETSIRNWDIRGFLRTQYPENIIQDLRHVLVTTAQAGDTNNAYLTTVQCYLRKMWPKHSMILLISLQDAISHGATGTSCALGNENFQVKVNLDRNEVFVTGSEDFVVAMAQQLAWLSAACRATESGLLCSHAFFREETISTNESYPQFVLSNETTPFIPDEVNSCWHPLLKRFAIATGFRIPDRVDEQKELEIPLEIMASLGGARVIVLHKGGYLLKGRSVMFVPVRKILGAIQWHLVYKSQGRIEYKDVCITAMSKPFA